MPEEKYIEDRVRALELKQVEHGEQLASLHRWRQRDEPRIQAAIEADVIAEKLSERMGNHQTRKLRGRDRALVIVGTVLALVAAIAQIADLFQTGG